MITMTTNQIPMTAMTRSRAPLGFAPVSAATSRFVDTHVDRGLTWSPVTDASDATSSAVSRQTSVGNPIEFVRTDAAAVKGAVPALGTAAGSYIGRKQGRPPRGEPR